MPRPSLRRQRPARHVRDHRVPQRGLVDPPQDRAFRHLPLAAAPPSRDSARGRRLREDLPQGGWLAGRSRIPLGIVGVGSVGVVIANERNKDFFYGDVMIYNSIGNCDCECITLFVIVIVLLGFSMISVH